MPEGLTIEVWVHPRARRCALRPPPPRWEAWVPQPPEKNQANEAVITLLAEYFRVPRSAVRLVAGAHHRQKTFHILSPPQN